MLSALGKHKPPATIPVEAPISFTHTVWARHRANIVAGVVAGEGGGSSVLDLKALVKSKKQKRKGESPVDPALKMCLGYGY